MAASPSTEQAPPAGPKPPEAPEERTAPPKAPKEKRKKRSDAGKARGGSKNTLVADDVRPLHEILSEGVVALGEEPLDEQALGRLDRLGVRWWQRIIKSATVMAGFLYFVAIAWTVVRPSIRAIKRWFQDRAKRKEAADGKGKRETAPDDGVRASPG